MKILEKLEDESVVYFNLIDDKTFLEVMELCDHHYHVYLNKKQLKQFIVELQEVYNEMKDVLPKE